MGYRLSKIYTRTGDDGTTGLGDGSRCAKDSPRIEACGSVDELNSILGLVLAGDIPAGVRDCLTSVQHELLDLGGELSIPGHRILTREHITRLEHQLDHFNRDLPPLKEFILPGGGPEAAACHLARAVCRRAERRVVSLAHQEPVEQTVTGYLNRLSDLLFVIARFIVRDQGGKEQQWEHDRE